MNQILLIDKPAGWTSLDVVAKIRGLASKKIGHKVKVGHAGTLDPFATGLLIVLVGEATKQQDKYMKLDKKYEATLRLGAESTTDDPEGVITAGKDRPIPKEVDVRVMLDRFVGDIMQVPPIHSAIKIDGTRAYKLAQAGEKPEMKPRVVIIFDISPIRYQYPNLDIRVSCSSGTYIRTLARDIGKALGCGAYLTALRRTGIGDLSIEDANPIDNIEFV